MIRSRFAIICGISIAVGHAAFGQDQPQKSIHEVIALMEADLHGFDPQPSLPRLPAYLTGELVMPIAPPRREVAPSAPISITRLKHKIPRDAKRAFQKAWVLDQEGNTEKALEEFRRAVKLDPEYAEAHCDLGALYQRLQRYADAESEFRLAVALAPELSGMHSNLGWALAMQGKIAEAEASAFQAVRIWGGNYRAHQLLGRILSAIPARQPEAIEHLETAVRLLSGGPERTVHPR